MSSVIISSIFIAKSIPVTGSGSAGASGSVSLDQSSPSSYPSDSDTEMSSDLSVMRLSQGGSVYHIPICVDSLKPVVDMLFASLLEAIDFYKAYALECGFVVRLGGARMADDVVALKYLHCSRQGFKTGQNNTKRMRRRPSNRVGCKAKLTLTFAGNQGYKVTAFEDRHTHEMVVGKDKQFMKSMRKLDFGHKKFVMDCEKAHIGPVRCHRIFKELVGGYSQVGASAVDFKNYRRDMLAYIGGSDAQMTINRLFKKKELCPAFFFEYDVDSCDRLTRLFWADPVSRKNFSLFGDVVSFDATYRTNRYNLIFIPFAGLDHHKSSVTFAAGLIFKEDAGSYVWLLEKFKAAMVHEPKVIVTDQDLSMKSAVEKVFPRSRHRLCMWHIMKKVPEKTKYDSAAGSEFRARLDNIVWTHDLSPSEFETQWAALLDEFPLVKRRWFDDMFAIRQFWIPAYFRDVMFGGLLRTTSVSESANSYFGHFSDRYYRLVELVMHFDIAMDTQRHKQAKLNFESSTMRPDLKTPLGLEKHASEVYTLSIFKLVQDQIMECCLSCFMVSMSDVNGTKLYGIKDCLAKSFTVEQSAEGVDFLCSCHMFQRIGLPCCHLIFVFRNLGFDRIPDRYVLARWTMDASITPVFTIDNTVVSQCAALEEREAVMNEVISDFYSCVGLLEDKPDLMKQFSVLLKEKKASLLSGSGASSSSGASNLEQLQSYAGVEVPSVINVLPPEQAKNKGSGSRIRSGREISIASNRAGQRHCGRCNKLATHNSRTCTEVLDS